MEGDLFRYLEEDHDRLDKLLTVAVSREDGIDLQAYGEFRSGLVRHIRMEERLLLPVVTRIRKGTPLPIAERIRLDHGALTALMVPPPTRAIINTIRSILHVHNALEEQEGGVYNVCEQLAGPEAEDLLERLKAVPSVPLHPYNEQPEVLDATKRALERAGYRFLE